MELIYSQIDGLKKETTQKQPYLELFWKISDNDIIELARSLYAANISFYKGRKTKFIEIERELELFFNKKVKRPHNKITRISERVNVAPFLDFLKDSYISDLESRL